MVTINLGVTKTATINAKQLTLEDFFNNDNEWYISATGILPF